MLRVARVEPRVPGVVEVAERAGMRRVSRRSSSTELGVSEIIIA